MTNLPKKVEERLAAGLKRFQPILATAKDRDVNESDTVVIITDMLHELFGYDKYSEITREHSIRGTYCDLAIKVDGHLTLLVEAKAIGIELKEQHVKQAVDYAANEGCDWVALTNGIQWKVYKIVFSRPVEHELVVAFDLQEMSPRNPDDLQFLGLLAKEGWQRARLGDYHSQRRVLNRFVLGAVVLSTPVVEVVRRELRRLAPEVRVSVEDVAQILQAEVLKREVLEGDKADAAKRSVSKAASRTLRATHQDEDSTQAGDPPTSES